MDKITLPPESGIRRLQVRREQQEVVYPSFILTFTSDPEESVRPRVGNAIFSVRRQPAA